VPDWKYKFQILILPTTLFKYPCGPGHPWFLWMFNSIFISDGATNILIISMWCKFSLFMISLWQLHQVGMEGLFIFLYIGPVHPSIDISWPFEFPPWAILCQGAFNHASCIDPVTNL
jgi:hypothetical protein